MAAVLFYINTQRCWNCKHACITLFTHATRPLKWAINALYSVVNLWQKCFECYGNKKSFGRCLDCGHCGEMNRFYNYKTHWFYFSCFELQWHWLKTFLMLPSAKTLMTSFQDIQRILYLNNKKVILFIDCQTVSVFQAKNNNSWNFMDR